MNEIVHTSKAAVVGTVQSVGDARWNSPDGSVWEKDLRQEEYATPGQYRDATVKVEEVVFNSPGLMLATGESVQVRLYGTGEPTGSPVGGGPVRRNQLSGDMSSGEKVLLFLTSGRYHLQGDVTEEVIGIVGGYQGTWTIVGDSARSVDPRRSVPYSALRAKIEDERQRGRAPDPEDSDTRYYPLGEDRRRSSTPPPAQTPDAAISEDSPSS